jgi:hypothetical protein
MLGKWLRTSSRPAEPDQSGLPVPREPTDDELATILALVVVSDHDVAMIEQRTRFSNETASAAVAELDRRGVVADAGGGFYKASQGSCPGTCGRGGHELRGQEIVITPPSFEWWCAPCWDAERADAPPGS